MSLQEKHPPASSSSSSSSKQQPQTPPAKTTKGINSPRTDSTTPASTPGLGAWPNAMIIEIYIVCYAGPMLHMQSKIISIQRPATAYGIISNVARGAWREYVYVIPLQGDDFETELPCLNLDCQHKLLIDSDASSSEAEVIRGR
jgi:hypothetical protein